MAHAAQVAFPDFMLNVYHAPMLALLVLAGIGIAALGALVPARSAARATIAQVQQPRVPIWVGGDWPHKPPARRAARWDGAVLTTGSWDQPPEPAMITDMRAYIDSHRREAGVGEEPFDLVVGGSSPGDPAKARDVLGPLSDAGATWWDERLPIDKLGKLDPARAHRAGATAAGLSRAGYDLRASRTPLLPRPPARRLRLGACD